MLAIRFRRTGRKNRPHFRLIISDKRKDPWGDFLEILGYYDPIKKITDLKKDRILYWIQKGAQASATVHNFLVDKNIVPGPKHMMVRKKKLAEKVSQEASAPVSLIEKSALEAQEQAEEKKQ